MIKRTIAKTALQIWTTYPVVTITGPRQSGKTTLAQTLFPDAEYVNLEIPDIREEATRDARAFMERHRAPAIFDEIQNAPEIVRYVQAEVDKAGRNSMYVLTGSHQHRQPPACPPSHDFPIPRRSHRHTRTSSPLAGGAACLRREEIARPLDVRRLHAAPLQQRA